MSEILGADGRVAHTKFIHGADESRTRGPQYFTQNRSLDDLITDRDRDVIVSLSKRLAANLGPVKCVVDQKSTYSVGQAWMVSYAGKEDREQAKEVVDYFHDTFYSSLDVRGGQWDWHENLRQVSKEIDISGDHFTLLTASEDGTRPEIQNIPAYSVKTKGSDLERMYGGSKIKSGTYAGNKIISGIIYNDRDRPVAYRVSTGTGNEDFDDIPANSIHHSFNPSQSDGRRGLPAATSSLNELKHVLQSTESESRRQLILASIGLLVENQDGGMDQNDAGNQILGLTASDGSKLTTQRMDSSIWYAEAGSGYKITQHKHETGGDSFESFQDRMIRSFVCSADWSYSLIWKPTGQGTAERAEIMQARQAVIERQKRLDNWASRVASYAYAFKAQRGELPLLKSPFSWKFSKPPRITIDDGREEKMLNESLRIGTRNLDEVLSYMGKTRTEFLQERADIVVEEAQIFEAAEQAHADLKLDRRRMFMLTANETMQETVEVASASVNTDDDDNIIEIDEEEKESVKQKAKFDNLKSKYDAYGVGVRAGAITPIKDDEVEFRLESGLPKLSDASNKAWAEDGGFRRPLTIVSKVAPPASALPTPINEDDE